MNIVVAGLGYVGSSLAVMLAHYHHVIAIDILASKVEQINNKQVPIVDEAMSQALASDTLDLHAVLGAVETPAQAVEVTTTPTQAAEAYAQADIVIVATPTDYLEQEDEFDTSSVEEVVQQAIDCGTQAIIVVKSTVPIGFTRKLQNKYPNHTILFCPEFLREGSAYADTLQPERILVGAQLDSRQSTSLAAQVKQADQGAQLDSQQATQAAQVKQAAQTVIDIFAQGCTNKETLPTRIMGFEEAESVKLFANTYLAMRVAFFNELDLFAEQYGLDSAHIIEGVCMDSRIGDYYNNPSFGYGGYCLPKDTRQLLSNYRDLPSEIVRAIVEANTVRKTHIARQIITQGTEKIVGIYLLSMKAQSDNYRNSPVLDIMRMLRGAGMTVIVHDPALANDSTFNGFEVEQDLDAFKEKCDIILANRYSAALDDVASKVYTRDIFHKN